MDFWSLPISLAPTGLPVLRQMKLLLKGPQLCQKGVTQSEPRSGEPVVAGYGRSASFHKSSSDRSI